MQYYSGSGGSIFTDPLLPFRDISKWEQSDLNLWVVVDPDRNISNNLLGRIQMVAIDFSSANMVVGLRKSTSNWANKKINKYIT